jgi:hypothetical protein
LLYYDEEQLQTIICMHNLFLFSHILIIMSMLPGESNVLQTINGGTDVTIYCLHRNAEFESSCICIRPDLAYLIDCEESKNRLLLAQ